MVDRERFREVLVEAAGGCDVQNTPNRAASFDDIPQHGGWPCNTCFHDLTQDHPRVKGRRVDLPQDIHDYWQSVLGFRGDYPHIVYSEELLEELMDALEVA